MTAISGYQFVLNQWKEHKNDSQWLTDHDSVVRDVVNWTVHQNYSYDGRFYWNLTGTDGSEIKSYRGFPTNDLALLQLSAPIQSSPVLRNSICVPSEHYMETVGSYVMFAGYGRQLWGKNMPAQVSYAVTKPITVPTVMVTTWSDAVPCDFDYGGPVWKFVGGKAVLLGVHSKFLDDPVCSQYETIHTRVSYYIDWIIEVTGLDRSHLEVTGHK